MTPLRRRVLDTVFAISSGSPVLPDGIFVADYAAYSLIWSSFIPRPM